MARLQGWHPACSLQGMKNRNHPSSVSVLLLLCSALSAPVFAGGERPTSFVQATIVARDPGRGTVTFVDASGRQRTERAEEAAAVSLARLQPGDETIVGLASTPEGMVVTRVLLAHRTGAPAEASPAPAASPVPVAPAAPSVPLRRSWPNPFAKR